ncbi:ATP-dependent DNA helicase UvrD2 [Brooklawnia cerclae]|nr:ATP-dependent DNA helicase UvrD2 [Brooklawnia cerclae]
MGRLGADEVLGGLDPQQRVVATSFGSPVVVLAGAGTGKTRAITHRIAYGALTGRIDPRRALAVTFTTKAAGELRSRLHSLGVPGVQARTFHSAALRQLSYFWPRVNGTELPPVASSVLGLVAEAARPLGVELETGLLRDLAGEISWAKVSNVPADRYPELAGAAGRSVAALDPDQVSDVLVRYEQVKKRRAVIDFDDILLCTIALLHEHPEVAEQVRAQYRHLTVDEFQDVSPVQRTLLELWLGEGRDVCVVGDPNQAIHTFAGAQPRYLEGFAREHPGALTLRLETNHRSTPEVLEAANATMGRGLRLRAVRPAGPRVEVAMSADEPSEAAEVAEWLRLRHEAGITWAEQAVLFRINAQAEMVQEALDEAGVPCVLRDAEGRGRSRDHRSSVVDAVTLSTIHSAKGLEWEAVAVIGLTEGMLPFVLATTPAQIAEERRLLHVAITRARTDLRLSWAPGGASGHGQRQPSRFLRDCGLTGGTSSTTTMPVRRRARPRTLPLCRVCGRSLSEAAEIKLGRHADCPGDVDVELFEALRAWRLRCAREQSLPAFVIFTEATLRALAEQRPSDRAGLLRIQGIGIDKAERYGDQVLGIIRAGGPATGDVTTTHKRG